MKFFGVLLAGLVLGGASARAELLGYWDFNDNITRSAGLMGTLSIQTEGYLNIGFDDFGLGTDVNLLPGFSEGDSKGFYSLADIAETTRFTVLGLDFTGYTAPVISFAARNDAVFQAGDDFYLEYNVGSGWVRAQTFLDPSDDFTTFSFTFASGALDNVSNAGLRFSHFSGVSALDEFEVDNLQINATAVPEPSALALMALAGLALAGGLLRRRIA